MASRHFLTGSWIDLALIQFAAQGPFLDHFAPPGTRPLAIRGRHLISLVGFRFAQTRLLGVPIPFHQTFDEINLRFYVETTHPPRRHGVVFVKELVPRRAVAWVARWLYNENYHWAPVRRELQTDGSGNTQSVRYVWGVGTSSCQIHLKDLHPPQSLETGSQAWELLENYHGFAKQRDGTTLVYQVEHPSWLVSQARDFRVEGNLAAIYGPDWGHWLSQNPISAYYSPGSEIQVGWGRLLGA